MGSDIEAYILNNNKFTNHSTKIWVCRKISCKLVSNKLVRFYLMINIYEIFTKNKTRNMNTSIR